MPSVAAIHTVFKSPTARRRVFGQGIPVSDRREPYTLADLQWWAARSNQTGPDYDALAAESEAQSQYERGYVPC